MTTLQYSRDELPIECPECLGVEHDTKTVKRDTFVELLGCCCKNCHHSFRVEVSEQ